MELNDWDKKAGHPMQGWAWGEFRQKVGNRVLRVTEERQYQIVWSKLYFLPWWMGYIPMGPVPTKKDLELLRKEALGNRAIGIRMEPNVQRGELTNSQFSIFNQFLKPGRKLFKSKTFWLDLTKSEEELLAAIYPKARYNIRLAVRHGVKIEEDKTGASLSKYLELLFGVTAKRQRIYSHSENYHRQMQQTLGRAGVAKLFTARWKGKIIAVWMVFVWKDFVYYAYGAFDERERDKMATVLGLWEIARWAKRQGYKTFDLWGAEEGRGFSKFKEQFGGELVETVGAWDLPVNKWGYWLFRIAEEARWKILRILK